MNPYESTISKNPKTPENKIFKTIKKFLGFLMIVIFFQGCTQIQKGIPINELTTFAEMQKISWLHALFVLPMAKILIGTHKIIKSTIVAIFLLTLFNRAIGLLFTFKSTIQQEKIKEIQPLINQINSKYGQTKDRQVMMQKHAEMQKLFKKHDVNPMGGIGSMFVAMPIFISTYVAIKDNAYIASTQLFGKSTALTTKEVLKQGFNFQVALFILLLVVLQWVSIKFPTWIGGANKKQTTQSAGVQKNMEIILPIMMLMISWNISTALLVYFTFSPVFTIAQSYFIHKYVVDKKAKEKSKLNILY